MERKFDRWIALATGILALGGGLWAALMLFNPIAKVDITVHIEKEIPISLPLGMTLPVHLVFEGKDISRATIFQLEILNSGSAPIGEDGKKWQIDLRNTDGATVVPLGEPRLKPTNLAVVVGKPASPDMVSLDIGLFNPGDSIGLDLMLVNPSASVTPPVVPLTRVPGLSQPVIGRLNVTQRLQNAFFTPIVSAILLIILSGMIWVFTRPGEWQAWFVFSSPWLSLKTIWNTVYMIAMLVFVAILLATGISWGLALVASGSLTR